MLFYNQLDHVRRTHILGYYMRLSSREDNPRSILIGCTAFESRKEKGLDRLDIDEMVFWRTGCADLL